jgi:hypothetical protein
MKPDFKLTVREEQMEATSAADSVVETVRKYIKCGDSSNIILSN